MAVRTLIVGLGSQLGDDQVGLRVVEQLAPRVGPTVEVRFATSPAQLLDWLEGIDELIICDACCCTAPSGTVHHWTWPTAEIENTRFSGSHDLPLPAVLELAAQLGRMPPSVSVWGVSVSTRAATEQMSVELTSLVPAVAERIFQNIHQAAH